MGSLLDAFMERCVFIQKTRIPDGENGYITEYSEGDSFVCAITLDSSLTAKIAERDGFRNVYTITTRKAINLEYGDIIKRYDGVYFRITSDGTDKHTPYGYGLDMRQVSAERWEKP